MRITREFKDITIIPLDDDSFVAGDDGEMGKIQATIQPALHLPADKLPGKSNGLDKSHVLILARPDSGDFSSGPASSRPNGNARRRRNGWIYFTDEGITDEGIGNRQ